MGNLRRRERKRENCKKSNDSIQSHDMLQRGRRSGRGQNPEKAVDGVILGNLMGALASPATFMPRFSTGWSSWGSGCCRFVEDDGGSKAGKGGPATARQNGDGRKTGLGEVRAAGAGECVFLPKGGGRG